jgi:hypothetical protein
MIISRRIQINYCFKELYNIVYMIYQYYWIILKIIKKLFNENIKIFEKALEKFNRKINPSLISSLKKTKKKK